MESEFAPLYTLVYRDYSENECVQCILYMLVHDDDDNDDGHVLYKYVIMIIIINCFTHINARCMYINVILIINLCSIIVIININVYIIHMSMDRNGNINDMLLMNF